MRVIIAGAGFGGLRLARQLSNKPGIEVWLIDRYNYHQFQPLFYQVATAGLDASNISFPLRKIFQHSRNIKIRLAEIKEVRPETNTLVTSGEEINYDVLVLAMGAGTNFFGNASLEKFAFPMKSTVEALQIRHRLLRLFEEAHRVKDQARLQQLMNIVVVGGGPTGVEVSGALAEMKKYILPKDYPELDFSAMRIILIEGSGNTLAAMRPASSQRAAVYLSKLGVEVQTNALVSDYDGNTVVLADGQQIPAATVIWAAGIKGNVPAGISQELVVKGNRVKTDRYCKVKGTRNIYAIGDLAYMETPMFPNGHPQVAPAAVQQANLLAHNLLLMEKKAGNDRLLEFEYHDKGSMATVGRNLAVVDLPKPAWSFGGFFAWIIWMGLHLMLILGVKNRFFVFLNWLYNYFTYDQHLRLIFREFERFEYPHPASVDLTSK